MQGKLDSLIEYIQELDDSIITFIHRHRIIQPSTKIFQGIAEPWALYSMKQKRCNILNEIMDYCDDECFI